MPAQANWVFVGARNPEGVITVGAFGARDQVLQPTRLNDTREENGVFWYMRVCDSLRPTPGSFGFAGKRTVDLRAADQSEPRSEDRPKLAPKFGGVQYRRVPSRLNPPQ